MLLMHCRFQRVIMPWHRMKNTKKERAGHLKLASRVDLTFPKHISTLFRNFKWGSFWANLDITQQFHYFKISRHNFQVGLIPGGLEYNIAKFSRNSREIFYA